MKSHTLAFIVGMVVGMVILATTSSCRTMSSLPTHVEGQYVPRPQVVRIFIGGVSGSSYEVFSDGVTVRYKKANGMFGLERERGETFTPDLSCWREFRQDLDRLGVWQWQTRYVRENFPDGTSWHVIVADRPGRIVSSGGSNAYPEGFEEFLTATRRLIGDREFR